MTSSVIYSAVYVSAEQVEKPLLVSLLDCFIFTGSLLELEKYLITYSFNTTVVHYIQIARLRCGQNFVFFCDA